MLNPNIFKAYDIRGIYQEDFDDHVAYLIAQAFVALRTKDGDSSGQLKIGIGADMRLSSPALKEELISGLIDAGVSVTDFGLVSTPAFYYSIAAHNLDGGIMVSASHNPGKWNGFKLVRQKGSPVSGETGIDYIKDLVLKNYSVKIAGGSIRNISNIAQEQLVADLNFCHPEKIKNISVVVDTANGMGAQYILELTKKLSIKVFPLNFNFDGTFPAHEADPLKEENMKQLQAEVLAKGADLGIATDGDGDRIFFVDNKGKTINPAIIRGLLAKIFLRDHPGSKIGYDVRPGKITEDLILEGGGIPVLTRVGHSLIKEQMLKEDVLFAGESSGHFYLNLALGCFEMPNIMISKLLEEFCTLNIPIADYIKSLEKYFFSGEINSNVSDKEGVIAEIAKEYSAGEINYLDGISVRFSDFWFNVRASNTEDKIRLNLEATSKELMIEKRDELLKLIQKF